MERLVLLFYVIICLNFAVFADGLTDGIELYNKNDYAGAVQELEKYVAEPDEPEEKRLLARAYLGASQFILGNKEIATGWFLSIIRDNPDYELNPVYFPPEIISFYNEVKESVGPVVFKREQKYFYLNFLPFGAGQFQNHDYIKGALIAGLEAVALTINLDTYLRRKAIEIDGKYPPERISEAKRLQSIQLISGGVFIAGYIYGVIDGSLNYKNDPVRIGVSILEQDSILSLSFRF